MWRTEAEGKTKVAAGGGKKKHKNPSHKPFKSRQSLRPSQSGQEPERNVEDGAEQRTGTFCFLIWNHFFFALSLFLFFFFNIPLLSFFRYLANLRTRFQSGAIY